MSKILALDISMKKTGWFVSKVSNGQIITNAKDSLGEKLLYFRSQVLEKIRKYRPTVVVIEDTFFLRNIQTLKLLCMFQGVAREVCAQEGVPVEIMTATQARKLCCGNQQGEFKKRQVFDYFVAKYGFEDFDFDTDNDITDAAALLWGFRVQEKNKNSKK